LRSHSAGLAGIEAAGVVFEEFCPRDFLLVQESLAGQGSVAGHFHRGANPPILNSSYY
jgi:hypothetical protein